MLVLPAPWSSLLTDVTAAKTARCLVAARHGRAGAALLRLGERTLTAQRITEHGRPPAGRGNGHANPFQGGAGPVSTFGTEPVVPAPRWRGVVATRGDGIGKPLRLVAGLLGVRGRRRGRSSIAMVGGVTRQATTELE
jgi:hypothetical protein